MISTYLEYEFQALILLKKYTARQVLYDYERGQQFKNSIANNLRLAMCALLY
jgi:hypothetical protein